MTDPFDAAETPAESPTQSPDVSRPAVARLVRGVEPALAEPLVLCLTGELSPEVTLMQLLCESESASAVRLAVDQVTANADADSRATDGLLRDRADALTRLLVEHEEGCGRIAEMLAEDVDSSAPAATVEEGIAHAERLFDWSVRQSEEASVALYSLGSADVLSRATAEVVSQLERWGLLGAERSVLQVGCGIGRFEAALSPLVRAAYGVDVSGEMIRVAHRRCGGLPNVHLMKTGGRDLSPFDDEAFDLVYSVDSFPYLVQSGAALVETHFAEARRVLAPGGSLVIFNYSYSGDLARDRAEVGALAAGHGFEVRVDGERPLALWNGAAWWMVKSR